jgi:hypothetical protein
MRGMSRSYRNQGGMCSSHSLLDEETISFTSRLIQQISGIAIIWIDSVESIVYPPSRVLLQHSVNLPPWNVHPPSPSIRSIIYLHLSNLVYGLLFLPVRFAPHKLPEQLRQSAKNKKSSQPSSYHLTANPPQR